MRRFYFPAPTPLNEALASVRAALDDEGLRLAKINPLGAPNIRLVRVDGFDVVIVPAARIEAVP